MEVMRGNELSHSYNTVNRTTILSGNSAGRMRKVKKIRKKIEKSIDAENEDDDSGSYEKIITKTKTVIVKKGNRRLRKGKGSVENDEYEYVEYDDDDENGDSFNGMQAIGVYSLYMSNGLTVKHRIPKPATCTTWNGNKVKTFDGLIYTHILRCSHTLIQDKIDGTFSIVLRACSNTQQEHCAHAIEIMMSNTKYILESMSM